MKNIHLTEHDVKTINNQSIIGSGNIDIRGKDAYEIYLETTEDSPTLTKEEWLDSLKGDTGFIKFENLTSDQIQQLNKSVFNYSTWAPETNINNFTIVGGVTKIPLFQKRKQGNLLEKNTYSFICKADFTYMIDFSVSGIYSTSGIQTYCIYGNNKPIFFSPGWTTTDTRNICNVGNTPFIFTPTEDTEIDIRAAYNTTILNPLYSFSTITILEISSIELKLAKFSINGKKFDEFNNIDLEGLSTLPSSELGVEKLTCYRHPVSRKPIYTKAFDFGTLANNATKTVPHNLTGIDWIKVDDSSSYSKNDNTYSSVMNGNYSRITADLTNIINITTTNQILTTAIVVLKYTKTNDTANSPVALAGSVINEPIPLDNVLLIDSNGNNYKLKVDTDGRVVTENV